MLAFLVSSGEQGKCSIGRTIFGANCYKLFSQTLNWEAAEKHCQGEGGHLASVQSAEENNFLTGMTTEMHWLGATDIAFEGDWVWQDGTARVFTDWKAGQPDNNNNNENCLMKNFQGAQWNDGPCIQKNIKNVVCKLTLEKQSQ